MVDTIKQYREIIFKCLDLFTKKMNDYGPAWRILRLSSMTDQIFIKAKRIRSLEEKKTSKVNEGVESEYIGMINYSVMAITQLKFPSQEIDNKLSNQDFIDIYNNETNEAFELMMNKNHDYGEAWREMRVSSITDLILQKLLRIKQIEDNDGKTQISEGLEANYYDIINYSVFALIRLSE